MAASGLGAGAWGLVPLALLMLLTSGWASRDSCGRWSAFEMHIKEVNKTLQSCPSDCNSTQIIEPKCKCLNLNTSESCKQPWNLDSGLTALNHTLPDKSFNIEGLMRKLQKTYQSCTVPDNLKIDCKSSVSPKSFMESLERVKTLMSSSNARK